MNEIRLGGKVAPFNPDGTRAVALLVMSDDPLDELLLYPGALLGFEVAGTPGELVRAVFEEGSSVTFTLDAHGSTTNHPDATHPRNVLDGVPICFEHPLDPMIDRLRSKVRRLQSRRLDDVRRLIE